MRLFLSHSNQDNPLVRDIIEQLPDFLETWMDETHLTIGTDLSKTLASAIQVNSDFVIVFIGKDAIDSPWVQREVKWALKQERQLGREFLLPILIEKIDELPDWMKAKTYRTLPGRDRISIKALGDQLAEDLFRLLATSWDRLNAGASVGKDNVTMSGMIDCDHVDVIADRTKGPYGQSGWLRTWQEQRLSNKTEVIVVARTAKWWYDQIRNENVVPSQSLSISILASDPIVDRRLLAADDRSEFSDHLEIVLRDFAAVSRAFEHFEYLLTPILVLDSFTFVKSIGESASAALVVLDLYTGTRYGGPRPQIIFQHSGNYRHGRDCIVSRMEGRARRMLASGGQDVIRSDARKIAQPFKSSEEEPSRRDTAGRLAKYAVSAFDFYDNISYSIAVPDKAEPLLPQVPAPACVQIEITDKCIVKRCRGCSRGLKRNPEEMSLGVFKNLVSDLFQMGTKSIILSGGEPLIHPRIKEFLTFAAEMDMSIAVLTDGLAISESEGLADVLGATVSSIRISMDGFTAKSYRSIRHLSPEEGDPIDRVERGISLLDNAHRDSGARLEHIGICVTLFNSNVDQIDAAKEWVARHDLVDSLVFKFAHGDSGTVSHTGKPFTCSASDVVKAKASIASVSGDVRQHQTGNARYVSTFIEKMGPEAIASGKPTAQVYDSGGAVCFSPILFSLVDPSGGVYICCHTYYDNSSEHENRKDLFFGNISGSSFRKIWHQTAFSRVDRIHDWNTERNALRCTCPMRNECTRHWKHNQLLTSSFDGYRKASLTGRRRIADEIRQCSDSSAHAFWL